VPFIDEAYSLMSDGREDGFSEEAMSEIISQMENNPDTIVIFAGYSDKMKHFIEEANPGLRSRITSVINSLDYLHRQMVDIFNLLLKHEDYLLENELEQYELETIRGNNIGNGRKM